jgi:uncharacterized RDD family membrane protein YckC
MASDAVLAAADRVVRPSTPPAASGDGATPATAPAPPAPLPAGDGPVHAIGDAAASLVAGIAPAVIERIDIDAIVGRVDVNRVLERVDVNAILDRVDTDRLIDGIDVDRAVRRVDMASVAREAVEGLDVGELVRESTMGLGGDVVRDARLHAMRADRAVERAADRLLHREPRGAVIPAPGRATSRAGLVSRVLGILVDSLVVVLFGLMLLLVMASVRLLWTGDFGLEFLDAAATRAGAVALLVAYLTYGWGLDGRTVGNLAMGLRVFDEGGTDLSFPRAFVRALLVVIFPIGLLWAAVSARSSSVQDLIVRTVVVHDWGRMRTPGRPARRGEAV